MITDADQIPDDARETIRRCEGWLADAVKMDVVQPGWDIRWEKEAEDFWARFTTTTGVERDLASEHFVGYLVGMADMAAHLAKRGQ
ncbi:hypothetical protein [Streptomyces atratus]|uniref:hypothetical protein n=1 Tax=Streptomyces atratus TaxID=1893 RepID=UPI003661EF35